MPPHPMSMRGPKPPGKDKKPMPRAGYPKPADDKENQPTNRGNDPVTSSNMFAYSPRKDRGYVTAPSPFFAMTPGSTMKTPFAVNTGDFPSRYFDGTPNKDMSEPNFQGMTPLSNLRETFSTTPFNGDGLFSPSADLNKTLFGDDGPVSNLEAILKTPKPRASPKCLRIVIGGNNDVERQFRHVTISPISEAPKKQYTTGEPSAAKPAITALLSCEKSTNEVANITQDDSIMLDSAESSKRKRSLNLFEASSPKNIFRSKDVTSTTPHNITMEAPSPFTVMTPGGGDKNDSWSIGFSPTEPDFTPFDANKRRKVDGVEEQ